jgi:hypothetical protein
MPVILATQEAEIRSMVVQSHETLSRKKPAQKSAGKEAQTERMPA